MADGTTTNTDSAKPGYKTTEFWLTLAALLLTALYASGAVSDTTNVGKVIALVSGVLGSLGYTVGRSMIKAKS